jgi:adenosylcobinamide-phosphate synthase
MSFHLLAFVTGFLLDLLLGDPHWMPHPIRLIGKIIGQCKKWNREELNDRQRLHRGAAMVCLVVSVSALCAGGLLFLFYRLHPFFGCMLEAVMTYQILATKCLKVESMKVYERLKAGDLPGARRAVSMIVGRDTECLDEIGVTKAAVETVAENTSDGVIAPMLYLAIGGPVLGFAYKAINTMDSMVGYKNETYLYFGRCAARLDDIVNFIPSRVSALLMILSGFLPGQAFDGRNAWRIWRRDGRKHASPNAAQTESACAGSLGIRLAGNASYFGKMVEKPTIGDAQRPIEYEDIARANRLLYRTAFLCAGICVVVIYIFCYTI